MVQESFKVKDITVGELKEIIREVIQECIPYIINYPAPPFPPFPPERTWYTSPDIPDKGPWC